MYLPVSRGNSSEGTDHTWKEINSYSAYDYDKMGVDLSLIHIYTDKKIVPLEEALLINEPRVRRELIMRCV